MKKIVKLIMELIFIFILPLLFILLSIDIKKEDVYNADNLLESETKTFEYNNQLLIDVDNPQYINYLNFNQQLYELSSTYWHNASTSTIYNNGEASIIATQQYGQFYSDVLNTIPNHYYLITAELQTSTNTNQIVMRFSSDTSIAVNCTNTTSWQLIQVIGQVNSSTNRVAFVDARSSSWDSFSIKNVMLIDLTIMFGIGYEETNLNIINSYIDLTQYYDYNSSFIITIQDNSIISENYKVNYTPFGSLKRLVLDQFHLNDNFIVKVLFDYTVIWFVMFLLWHLFYGLFDGLIHMLSFDRKRE